MHNLKKEGAMSSFSINANYGNKSASFNNIQTITQNASEDSIKKTQEQPLLPMKDTVSFSSEAMSKSSSMVSEYRKNKSEAMIETRLAKLEVIAKAAQETLDSAMEAPRKIAEVNSKSGSAEKPSKSEAKADTDANPASALVEQQLEEVELQMEEIQAEIQALMADDSEASQMKLKALRSELATIQSLHSSLSEEDLDAKS